MIVGWQGVAVVEVCVVRREMASEKCDWRLFRCPLPAGFAVSAILWREHQLLLRSVEIAVWPAIVTALLDLDEFLRRQILTLVRCIKLWPVVIELVAPVLCRVELAARVECESLGGPYFRSVAVGR